MHRLITFTCTYSYTFIMLVHITTHQIYWMYNNAVYSNLGCLVIRLSRLLIVYLQVASLCLKVPRVPPLFAVNDTPKQLEVGFWAFNVFSNATIQCFLFRIWMIWSLLTSNWEISTCQWAMNQEWPINNFLKVQSFVYHCPYIWHRFTIECLPEVWGCCVLLKALTMGRFTLETYCKSDLSTLKSATTTKKQFSFFSLNFKTMLTKH